MLAQVSINALMLSAMYILLALGITMIFGVMLIINFTHGSIYMLGAFTLWFAYAYFGLNYPLSVVITFIAMFVVGIIIERIALRPVRGDLIRGIITTLGFMYIIDAAGLLGFTYKERAVPPVITGTLDIAGAVFPMSRLIPTIAAFILIVALLLFVRYTKIGRALRATAQNREAASLYGVNTNHMFALAFGIGSGLAGLAAALMAPVIIIHPALGQAALWKCFIIIIIGGLGSMPGAIAGGLILGLNDSFLATYAGTQVSELVAFSFVIVLLVLRPRGLLGVYEL